MFSFFRKHQRFFFATTALFVATSLISFGTWRISSGGDDRHVFKTPGKNRHERKEIEILESFLAREAMEGNPLNDGVISIDFLKNGLAEQLAAHFSDQVGGDLIAALPRELRWRPYLHPQFPSLNQKALWRYFCPALAAHHELFTALSTKTDPTRLFAVKQALYLAQSDLPAEQLRRAIQEQSSALNIDAGINAGDLELFGYGDLRAWFGPNLMRLAAQVILLGAEEAENMGIEVSHQEVKADLVAAAARLRRRALGNENRGANADEIAQIYRYCQQLTHLSEKDLLACWRRILLFRHFVSARKQSWGLDASLPFALDDFAKREKRALFFTFDDSLKIDTPNLWEQFEIYCRLVARDALTCQGLPEQFKEPSQLWEVAPQLLQSSCKASRTIVSRSQLRADISQRRVTQWLLDGKNWQKVRACAPQIGPAESDEARSHLIETLKSGERDRLDQIARTDLLEQDPDVLQRALQQPKEDIEWTINGAGLALPFSSVKRPREFVELVKKAWNLDPDAAKALLHYEADGDTIISLRLLNSPNWEIAPWQKALSKGWMKELVGAKRAPKCSASELAKAKQRVQDLAQAERVPDAWLNWRAFRSLQRALDRLSVGKSIVSIAKKGGGLTFSNQWHLREETKQISQRSFEAENWPGLFSKEIKVKGWSQVQFSRRPLGFYQILDHHRILKEDECISALDPELALGAEQSRAQIARQLDRDFANRWLLSQIGNLCPPPPLLSAADGEGERG